MRDASHETGTEITNRNRRNPGTPDLPTESTDKHIRAPYNATRTNARTYMSMTTTACTILGIKNWKKKNKTKNIIIITCVMGVKSHRLSGASVRPGVCDLHQEVGVWISSGHVKTVKKKRGRALSVRAPPREKRGIARGRSGPQKWALDYPSDPYTRATIQ